MTHRPHAKRRQLALPLGPALLLALLLQACGHEERETTGPDPGPASAPVHAGVVSEQTIPVFEEVVGSVQPRYQASVSAKITGRILRSLVEPGARVEKDELLAELEISDLRAALDRVAANLENARRNWERYRNLQAGVAVSKVEVDRAESDFLMAQAEHEEMKRRIDYSEIKAPFTGIITRRFLEAGDLAVPGKPIYRIEDAEDLRLEIDVAESGAGAVKLGQPMHVRVDGANVAFDAAVSEISPSADIGSRTFLIKLDLPPHEDLRAGQFGRAFLPRGEKKTVVVRHQAVLERGQLDIVYVIEDGRTAMRIVRIGNRVGDGLEILSGLQAGESIVLDPPPDLRGGQILEILK